MSQKILPIKHLSARVPWHDNLWKGTYCKNVLDNSFCRILPRIDDQKGQSVEPDGEKIAEDNLPPCIAEKGAFLSTEDFTRPLRHAWTDINPLYKEFLPGKYIQKKFSINAVPFLWMMKGNAKDGHESEIATLYGLDYDPELEAEIDSQLGFEGNTWVQHPDNQRVMLDSFFGCLQQEVSLIFFYAKHTPISELNVRVIVGVAKVRRIGDIQQYEFPDGYTGHRGYPWERCVEHSLVDQDPDGFLLPYHDLIDHANKLEIDVSDHAVVAPDFGQFSYGSELVEHDTAIDSLWLIAESLRKSEVTLGRSFKRELQWIDAEISRIWDMRGAFPGMGAVLSALKIREGNSIAWEIEKFIRAQDGDQLRTNPWDVFEQAISDPGKVFGDRGLLLFSKTNQRLWKSLAPEKKQFAITLSRIQLNNDQAILIWDQHAEAIAATADIARNPFLIFEKLRITHKGEVSFSQIDKAFFPPEKIRQIFPLPPESAMSDLLDERRVRAFAVTILEQAADEGHSLMPIHEVLARMAAKEAADDFPISEDELLAQAADPFFQVEIMSIVANGVKYLKLQRLAEIKRLIGQRINKTTNQKKLFGINYDWDEIVRNYFEKIPVAAYAKTIDEFELLARREKAEALRTLCNHRISVLIGPAGSGKTTLLEMFEEIPEIKAGGLIKLAPTGKARVKMGNNAKTVAQFLLSSNRYIGAYNIYVTDENAPKDSSARNIIIDESSMLTEEQLGAILDALGPMDRIILAGDYRQLPPIGTGRPFVDIVNLLKPEAFDDAQIKMGPGYAELRQIRRQKKDKLLERPDIILSRCFGDEPQKEELELFQAVAGGQLKSQHLRLEKWYDSKDFREKFQQVLTEELGLDPQDAIKSFNRTLGAKDVGDYQYFNADYAEKCIEDWQIISPVNGYGYGVKEINKFIQSTYRKGFIDLAHNISRQKRKIAKPKGSDNIVYGDKVISLKNNTWRAHQWIKPSAKKSDALNYFANGEIGVLTGEFRGQKWGGSGEPKIEITFSTQPGYSYVFWPNELDENGKYPFDLAYAITVHKAQGSGFNKVFFVLPAQGSILCRELLYTALTRQEDKVIIMHQGEFRDFVRFAGTEASATARRFTDLFFMPDLKQIEKKYYDARYINVSERGERMISKSEVIIANSLNKYKKEISYAYENKLTLEVTGRTIKPDFTIENLGTGRIVYWEHLGMMSRPDYREKWLKKKQGYLDDGFVLFTEATTESDKVLIITEENPTGGIDSQHFDAIIRQYILA